MAADSCYPYVVHGLDDREPSDDTEDEDLEELKEYAEGDEDDVSMYLLGKKYLDEYDDPEEAEVWLQKAAEHGSQYAMYLLYKCYRDKRIEDKDRLKMKYLYMALDAGYDAAEYEYGKLLREKDPDEAMRYFKRAADQNHSYAALAYAKMCAESGDMDDASKYAYIAVAYNHKLAVRVGLWSYYDIGNRETGRWYLKYGADRGDRESADALKALDKGQNLNLAFGVLNLLYYACNIIADIAVAKQFVAQAVTYCIDNKVGGLEIHIGNPHWQHLLGAEHLFQVVILQAIGMLALNDFVKIVFHFIYVL